MSSIPPPFPSQPYPSPSMMPPAYPIPGVDAAGVVQDERPCRKCGYALRGLSIAGRCPECGAAVGLSIQGDLLRYSEPSWVRMLQRGVKLILFGIGIIILAAIGGAVVGATGNMQLIIVPAALGFVGSLLTVVGAWLLTEPDPSGIGEDRYGTSRKIIRVSLIVGLANSVLNMIDQNVTLSPDIRRPIIVLSALAQLVGLIGTFAQLNYLSKLAVRIPEPVLEARARFLMWAIGLCYGLLVIVGVVLALSGVGQGAAPARPTGGLAAAGCAAGILGLALLIFGIMYILMLDKFRQRFGEQAAAAEQSWARIESGSSATAAGGGGGAPPTRPAE